MSTATARAYRSNFAGRFMPSGIRKSPEIKPFHECRSTYSRKAHCIKDRVLLDPCMGSGHILVYAFDVLMQIYESAGYTQRDAAKSIIEKNLFGLDIDDRAAQLAYFAVMMKARQYNRRILDGVSDCNVYAIKESNGFDRAALVKMGKDLKPVAEKLIDTFVDAKEYGSILNVDLTLEELEALDKRLDDVDRMSDYGNLLDMMYAEILCKELSVFVKQARIMLLKYDAVITNPPYMNSRNMNGKLSEVLKDKYSDFKEDLFSVFIFKCIQMCKINGVSGYLSPYVWMFIQSHEKLREYIYNDCFIQNLIQFEYSAFDSATVPICAFTVRNTKIIAKGSYLRLVKFTGGMKIQEEMALRAIKDHDCGYYYENDAHAYRNLPSRPVAYWISQPLIEDFIKGVKLGEIADPKQGMATMDNNRYLRLWFEISIENCKTNCANQDEATGSGVTWFPYDKGGDYRKWYGNYNYFVDWKDNGEALKNDASKRYGSYSKRIYNTQFFFLPAITWSKISSGSFSVRCRGNGCLFDVAGCSIFVEENEYYCIAAFLNSKIAQSILDILSPTLNYEVGHIRALPILKNNDKDNTKMIAKECIQISKSDWDAFETSWDFKKHPLV